jgi:hypothetical protein
MYPRWLSWENLDTFSMMAHALLNLSKTAWMSAPYCMEMILSWSSSLTQTKNDFCSLWKMPLPSGQSLFKPHASKNLSPSL